MPQFRGAHGLYLILCFACLPRALQSNIAFAEFFYHYNNIVPGDRALSLGGAYSAISDDASGLIYNPAGLGFSLHSTISGSANAIYSKRVEYKETIGNKSFVEKSQGFFPPFAGGTKKLDSWLPGLTAAFVIFSPDNEFKDQDDQISNKELGIDSFHRTENRNLSLVHFGAGFGYRALDWLSVGAGSTFFLFNSTVQSYQGAVLEVPSAQSKPLLSENSSKKGNIYSTSVSNNRIEILANGFEPIVGLQAALGTKVFLGFSAKKAFYNKQSAELNGDELGYFHFKDGSLLTKEDLKPETCEGKNSASPLCSGKVRHLTPLSEHSGKEALRVRQSQPFDSGPAQLRLGLSWFANKRWLLASDVTYHSATEGSQIFDLNRQAIFNAHLGTEVYLTPSLPTRFGVFTNADSRPKIKKDGSTGQLDHVDFLGFVGSLAWAQANGQTALGLMYQRGRGEGQKIAGSQQIQKIVADAYTFFFSATHNL